MAESNPPLHLTNSGANAANVRRFISSVFNDRYGILLPTDFAVTQQGTPNMGVTVAAGKALVDGTESATQGAYFVEAASSTNLTIAASDATNPRRDMIVAKVQDADYSGVANTWSLAVVTGTPAASPADPTVPANAIVLARVAVAALAASITNANITDLRTSYNSAQFGLVTAKGGTIICTSTTRPSVGLFEGMRIYETDTDQEHLYDGTNWQCTRGSYFSQNASLSYTATTSGTAQTSCSFTVPRGKWLVNASFGTEATVVADYTVQSFIAQTGTIVAQNLSQLLTAHLYHRPQAITAIVTVTAATELISLRHYRSSATGTVLAVVCNLTAMAV